jgi:hypothetical protein
MRPSLKETNAPKRWKKPAGRSKVNSMNSKQRCLRKIRTAFLVASLIPLLTSCAVDPVIETRIELQRVPEALLVPCPISSLSDSTYQGAIELALALRLDLAECNKRLGDIRDWSGR